MLSRRKGSGEVSVAGVREKNDNCFALVFGTLSKLDGRKTAAPEEIPTRTPSLCPICLPVAKASLSATGIISSRYLCVKHIGNEACADALNFMSAGNAGGKNCRGGGLNSNDLYVGFLDLRYSPTPVTVPPVPTPATKMSTCPSVSS